MAYNSQSFIWLENSMKYPIVAGKVLLLGMYSLKREVDGSSENKVEGVGGAVVSIAECRN